MIWLQLFFVPSLSSKVDLSLGVGLSINFGLVEPAVLVVHGLPGPGLLAGRHTDVDVRWDDEAEGLAHCFQVCTRRASYKIIITLQYIHGQRYYYIWIIFI